MSDHPPDDPDPEAIGAELADGLSQSTTPTEAFLADQYADQLERLIDAYPDVRSIDVAYPDLAAVDANVAETFLADPAGGQNRLNAALDNATPDTIDRAHVRVGSLPDEYTFQPGGFSPSEHRGTYRAITGEVVKVSDVYPRVTDAAFECKLCGTPTHEPQPSRHAFVEPHECGGCQRKNAFDMIEDRSSFVDVQKVRLKVPPELSDGNDTREKIDVYTEDDLAGVVTLGDRVTISGTVEIVQEMRGSKRLPTFDDELVAGHIEIIETDQEDLDITDDERTRIVKLAAGDEGEPLELAGESMAPKIHGYDTIKRALVLALVSGGTVEYPTGDSDRADLHVLVLGDPGTAKSRLVSRAADVGWRTVSVSSTRVTAPGLLAAADRDDFGDGEWSMKAGAFVRANGGSLCVDELDDMDPDARAAMLEPMSTQRFSTAIAGEQVTFTTEASVIAAGNPSEGRFNQHQPLPEQFDLEDALLSRFDLVYVVTDTPDKGRDKKIATHMLRGRDAAKRHAQGIDLTEAEADVVQPPVDSAVLSKWLALARQRPNPAFADDDVFEWLRDAYLQIRDLYNYSNNDPVPITARKLEGIVRVAEAAAKLEFSETIEMRHAKIATEIVGESMNDVGKNEEGELDANIHETGDSSSQKSRRRTLNAIAHELAEESDDGSFEREELIERTMEATGSDRDLVENDIENKVDQARFSKPTHDTLRWV